jgi:hypothetical protein
VKLREWYQLRGSGYVRERAAILLDRYGLTPAKAAQRTENCVALLSEHGCPPTLPTPGRVVDRHPAFVRRLQDAGAEIAVHSYDHVDLSAYPVDYARKQLVTAAQAFAHHGIEVHGFRCPYLRCGEELGEALPAGLFEYSSNRALWWDVVPELPSSREAPSLRPVGAGVSPPGDEAISSTHRATGFEVLRGFYRPTPAEHAVCTPWTRGSLIEIPLCVPDDLQIHDGLRLGPEGLALAWREMLKQTYDRGEAFVLLFHPELAWRCQQPFIDLLHEAAGLQPRVWTARLRDISAWWREKASFEVNVAGTPEGLRITFRCTDRATILVRGLEEGTTSQVEDVASLGTSSSEDRVSSLPVSQFPSLPVCQSTRGHREAYRRLPRSAVLDVPANPRPFVGLPADAPTRIVSFLREQGYVVDTGPGAPRCGVYLAGATLAGLGDNLLKVVNCIETSDAPLVRYWRWPEGAGSVLAITGDLDALTLWDYTSRLFIS